VSLEAVPTASGWKLTMFLAGKNGRCIELPFRGSLLEPEGPERPPSLLSLGDLSLELLVGDPDDAIFVLNHLPTGERLEAYVPFEALEGMASQVMLMPEGFRPDDDEVPGEMLEGDGFISEPQTAYCWR
jgi:hypothetical protein